MNEEGRNENFKIHGSGQSKAKQKQNKIDTKLTVGVLKKKKKSKHTKGQKVDESFWFSCLFGFN